jgi:hypothetical protein
MTMMARNHRKAAGEVAFIASYATSFLHGTKWYSVGWDPGKLASVVEITSNMLGGTAVTASTCSPVLSGDDLEDSDKGPTNVVEA